MSRYVLTPQARDDLRDLSDYISKSSVEAASRVRTRLRQAMIKLAEMPGMGHLREDLADETLRFWSVYSYLILYRPETRPLQILRVLHASRDVRQILEEK